MPSRRTVKGTAGRGRAGDLGLQGACGGLAASVTVDRKKGPLGHRRNAGEDPKGLEGEPLAVAGQATLTYKVPVGFSGQRDGGQNSPSSRRRRC
jgi:hypothetical protein